MQSVKASCLVASIFVLAVHCGESIEDIKKEYGLIFDTFFVQAREALQAKKDIAIWLYNKNTQEFKDIQNLTSDLRVELKFNHADETAIKKELQESLQKKIHDELQVVVAMDKVTAENLQDFFHISRMICDVTFESHDGCDKMMRNFKKEYHFTLRELKVVDKARAKIELIDKERKKQAFLDQLREQIIVGTQRK